MKPSGAISLDLDNHWSYLKIHGDEHWREYPTYLPSLVPLILEELDRAGMRATVFVVGRDAADSRNQPALASIVRRGHDIGNHSFEHEPWMDTRTIDLIRAEIHAAERAIERATGLRPRGFRGPGYVLSKGMVEVLIERGYLYDASTLPTFVGPLARWWYFRTAALSPEGRETRSRLFGDWKHATFPNRPHWIGAGSNKLLEMPVTVFPGIRLPFHASYLIQLAAVSTNLAMAYFSLALLACRVTRTPPSFLLHPLDFVGVDDFAGLQFFPGMTMKGARKRAILRRILALYARHFNVVAMDDAVSEAIGGLASVAGPQRRLEQAGT